LYFIGSTIAFLVLPLYLSNWSISGGMGGGGGIIFLFLYLLTAALYSLLAIVSAICLLKKKPHFIFPIGVIALSLVVIGYLAFVNIPEVLKACSSEFARHDGCEFFLYSLSFYIPLLGIPIVMIGLLLIGRNRYLKLVKLT
jgi:hypothetical protein